MEKFSRWLTPIVAIFFATALSVTASSTIGTDITTGGDLTVDGDATFQGSFVALPNSVTSGGGTTFDTAGDGTNWTFTASGGGNIVLNPGSGETILQGRARFAPAEAEPVACGAGTAGTVVYSSGAHALCVCDGTDYVQVSDTAQACVFGDAP